MLTLLLCVSLLPVPQEVLELQTGTSAGPQDSVPAVETSVSASSSGGSATVAKPAVETLFVYGGTIYLGNPDGGVVESILVENGRVVAAGTEKRLRTQLPEEGANLVDLKGAMGVPGIQDSHVRVERLGESLEQLDLRGVSSYADLVSRVAEVAERTPKGEWIRGSGWDQRLWESQGFPHHQLLSEAVPDHPVLLWRIDGKSSLVNGMALELAKLDGEFDSITRVQGGRVLLDDEAMPTGVLIDRATEKVSKCLPRPDADQRAAWILRAQDELLARGITCVHDMDVAEEALVIYESLRERGLLKLRVVAYVAGNEGLSDEILSSLPRRPDPLDQFSVPGVSFQIDGSLDTWSAALLGDYSDRPGERGHLWMTEEHLTLLVHEAWQAGLQPAIHAVGDRANRIALDAYERMIQVDGEFTNLRPRIEQARVISSRDIPRFPALHVIPSMQPAQTLSDLAGLEQRLGPNRSRGTYAWRSLAPGLLQLAFGSGLPFGCEGPLDGILAARIRRDHESLFSDGTIGSEGLDGLGALAGFTRGSAFAVHQEDRRGQLIPGFWADMTVFDQDPISGDTATLLDSKVLLTLINGRVVYSR